MQRDDDGVIDWTAGELRALGVGTPQILSPTAGVTRRDLYGVATADAQRRLAHLVDRVRLDQNGRLGGISQAGFTERRRAALASFEAEDARFFSDGTVHLPARLPLAWAAASLGQPGPAPAEVPFVGPPLPAELAAQWPMPTGVVLQVNGALSPSLRLKLDFPEGPDWRAGVAGDAVGGRGLRWFRTGAAALAEHVGAHPRVIEVRARGVGVVAVGAAARKALAGLDRLPTAVVLP